jgi:hypothetical protein
MRLALGLIPEMRQRSAQAVLVENDPEAELPDSSAEWRRSSENIQIVRGDDVALVVPPYFRD